VSSASGDAALPAIRFGRSFALALAGAVLGCVAVLAVSVVLGFGLVFLAFPLFAVFLALSAVIAAPVTALLVRLSTRRLSAAAITIVSAALTFLLFSALPVYFLLRGSNRAGGLLFG
jgi:hypothetical protein